MLEGKLIVRNKLVFKNRTATEYICSSSDLTLTTVIDWSFIEGYSAVPWSSKKSLAVDFCMIRSCSKNRESRRKIKWAVFMDNVLHLHLPLNKKKNNTHSKYLSICDLFTSWTNLRLSDDVFCFLRWTGRSFRVWSMCSRRSGKEWRVSEHLPLLHRSGHVC